MSKIKIRKICHRSKRYKIRVNQHKCEHCNKMVAIQANKITQQMLHKDQTVLKTKKYQIKR